MFPVKVIVSTWCIPGYLTPIKLSDIFLGFRWSFWEFRKIFGNDI